MISATMRIKATYRGHWTLSASEYSRKILLARMNNYR